MDSAIHPLLGAEATESSGSWRRWPARWRLEWQRSLRFRLLALGLMPLLVAFPFVLAVLAVVGGERADSLLRANLRTQMSGARNYLEQLRNESSTRVAQLARSQRLAQLVERKVPRAELDSALHTAAEGSGLDYLLVVGPDGSVVGSSTRVPPGARLPSSWVLRQARNGVAVAAFERFDAALLAALAPGFPEQARVMRSDGVLETRGLLINAAAHFPLTLNTPDAVLLGGMLFNRNLALIEHMRELLYPLGSLPGDAEGLTAIHVGATSVAASRQRLQGQRPIGTRTTDAVREQVIVRGQPWLGTQSVGGHAYLMGYEPLVDGEGARVGMIAVGFPEAPYLSMAWWLLGLVAALLALTMLVLSLVFIHAGRELTQRLVDIGRTMSRVRRGERDARVGKPLRDDELGRLAQHFNMLLNTIETQDAMQRAAQQAIADEASRRRVLFEKVRDGVVILCADGSVFEVNAKCAQMLGTTGEALRGARMSEWDTQLDDAALQRLLDGLGDEGHFYETVHRRRDGSTYEAEVSLSRAEWAGQTYVMALMRDISGRKAVEEELATYQSELETLVDLRTKLLNDRTEQLDAIFALSPDGFVSFDAERRLSFASPSFLALTGLTVPQVYGLDDDVFSALLGGRCQPGARFAGVATLRAQRQRADAQGVEAEEQRHQFTLAHPQPRVLEVGLRLAEGGSVSQVLYFRDVTHESEVDRMKSEFLTTAAHELRTPMTSIHGFVDLMRRRPLDEARRADVLATISRQSELMITIINQLLDLARIEARGGQDFAIEPLALPELMAAVLAGYRPPEGREPPQVAPPPGALPVAGDSGKLTQALLNVVSNAYKYSPQGGPVQVSWCVDDTPGARRVGVAIRDHGIGMSAEQLSHVCERFYRADASGNIPGTGLGMSIVKQIVELHRGTLALASTPGEGTTVTVWLPRAEP